MKNSISSKVVKKEHQKSPVRLIVKIHSLMKVPINIRLFNGIWHKHFGNTITGDEEKLYPPNSRYCITDCCLIKTKTTSNINYEKLIDMIRMEPMLVNIFESTNNRNLFFYTNYFRERNPMEPGLTIDGDPRPQKRDSEGELHFIKNWDEKSWNIADTHEKFIMDGKELIIIKDLKPNRSFQIVFNVFAKTVLSNQLRQPFEEPLIHPILKERH